MKYVFLLILLVLVAGIAFAGYVRLAPMEAADWHADPFDAQRTGKPNDFLVGPGGDRDALRSDLAPADLLAKVDAVAMAEPRVIRLAGSVEEGWITYVQRSALMGYPDAISIRARADGDGTELAVFSRSRFGHSDMGVNAARVTRWLRSAELME